MRSRCSMRSMRRPAKPGPILAPVASLAGDAQTLSTALSAHDNASASGAMTSILSDRDKIEAAAKIAGGQYPEQWTSIREKIAALEKQVPASKGPVARSEVPESHASVAPPAGEKMPDAPKIEIASRVFQAGKVRVKGFLEGTDLKSAGIFDGDTKTRDIDVASTPGEQRVNFDFSIEQPSPTQSIRVADVYGREAQAMVTPDPAAIGPMKGSEEMIEVDPGASASSRGEAGPLAESPLASAGPSQGQQHGRDCAARRCALAVAPSYRGELVARAADQRADQRDRCRRINVGAGKCRSGRADCGAGRASCGSLRQRPAGQADTGKHRRLQRVRSDVPDAGGQRREDPRIRQRQQFRRGVDRHGRRRQRDDGISAIRRCTRRRMGTRVSAVAVLPANPYAYANPNPYAPGYNPYAPNPYPYGYPPPYGTPPYGTPSKPWYSKLFH